MDNRALLDTFGVGIRARAGAIALYVGGSLATGDFEPDVSDLDLAAIIERPLDEEHQRQVIRLHRGLIASGRTDEKLHCVYVPADDVDDVSHEHLTWAFEELFRRPFSAIARAELLAHGYAVFGPPPGELIPAVSDAELHAAVRDELAGYWTRAARRWTIWLPDNYVDLGLTTLARAEATLAGDGLISKREAISRLDRFGVPPRLIEEMTRRRDGRPVRVSLPRRLRRAARVRRLVRDGISTVLSR
jgi:hypothetical protein